MSSLDMYGGDASVPARPPAGNPYGSLCDCAVKRNLARQPVARSQAVAAPNSGPSSAGSCQRTVASSNATKPAAAVTSAHGMPTAPATKPQAALPIAIMPLNATMKIEIPLARTHPGSVICAATLMVATAR
jgi:hypothetical protein